jgi:hypothetical protein
MKAQYLEVSKVAPTSLKVPGLILDHLVYRHRKVQLITQSVELQSGRYRLQRECGLINVKMAVLLIVYLFVSKGK